MTMRSSRVATGSVRLAYRMLGTMADAEHVLQEAYLRWHAADRGDVQCPGRT